MYGGNFVRTFNFLFRISNSFTVARCHKLPRNHFHTRGTFLTTTPSVQVTLKSVNDFKNFILSLDEKERRNLKEALQRVKIDTNKIDADKVFLQAALPFIGFGFLDNVIMILAGEYIDMTIGVTLGISTMAAAAIGNLVSDLLGLGLADSVEALCRKLGIPDPKLSLSEMNHTSVRWAQRLGRVIGITVGCIIGMAPLLWFDHKDDKETK